MRFFNFSIFPKYENKNTVNFKLVDADLECSFCKELLADPRVTHCCNKKVCFSCWKENRRLLDQKGVFLDFKVKIFEKEEKKSEIMWFICRLCSKMIPVPPGGAVERFEWINNYSLLPESFQEKIDAAMVICPDKNCQVSFSLPEKSSVIFLSESSSFQNARRSLGERMRPTFKDQIIAPFPPSG